MSEQAGLKSPMKRQRSNTHQRNRHNSKRTHTTPTINKNGKSLFDQFDDDNDIFRFDREIPDLEQRGDHSFLSLEPIKRDLNSFLHQVSSEIKIDLRRRPDLSYVSRGSRRRLLNIHKVEKLDLIQDRHTITNGNMLDEWELDCVVRASEYDSDTELKDDITNDDEEKDETFGINFSQLAESQEKKGAHNLFNTNSDEHYGAFPTTQLRVPTTSFTFDPTLTLTNKNETISIFNDYTDIFSTNKESTIKSTSQEPLLTTPTKELPREFCSPHHHILRSPFKSNFKPISKTLLNLIVESSDGNVDDAVRFATEINAQNCLGIPLPEKTTELVNIPTNGPPDQSGNRKSAIIRGVRAKAGKKKRLHNHTNIFDKENLNLKKFNHHLSQRRMMRDTTNTNSDQVAGFYTVGERDEKILQKQPRQSNNNSKNSNVGNKNVSWAEVLEW